MGVAIPQFIPEDRASGAHQIQGSLITQGTLNGSPFYLARTPGSAGNRRTFTWSCWFRRTNEYTEERFLSVDTTSADQSAIKFINDTEIQFFDRQSSAFKLNFYSLAQYRDGGGWYNLVVTCDTTQSTNTDRVHIYINGEEIDYDPSYDDYPSENLETRFNNTTEHTLFARTGGSQLAEGQISQICWIDGQQLDASYFGFTDGLTGTWRPKKFNISDTPTGSWGTCGYYLPMDGSAPIYKDQSGQGNDWQTVNGGRGNSIAMDKATGALPIRNTVGGGNILAPRVLGNAGVAVTVYDSGSGNKYYLDGVETASLDFARGQTVTFDTSDSTVSGHPFRFSPKVNGQHNTDTYGVEFDGSDYLDIPDNADFTLGTGDLTVEAWFKPDSSATVTDYHCIFSIGWAFQLYWYQSKFELYCADANGASYFVGTGGGFNSGTNSAIRGQYYHIAITRSGNDFRMFLNGTLTTFASSSTSFVDPSDSTSIGRFSPNNNLKAVGIISNLRFIKGTALYTSNFTPSYEPLTNVTNTKLLCCNQSTTTGSTVTPGTITANGDPASSTDSPFDVYNMGVVTGAISPGTVGAATTITFPHTAPNNLYYYCTAHSGMGGSGTIGLSTDIHKADPYAWKCVLALPYGDSLLDQSSQVACTSTEYTVDNASYGNPALTDDQNTAFYQNSLYLDGDDAVSLGIINDGLLELGANDFTVEFWWWGDTTLESSYWNPILAMPWTGNTNNYSQLWIGFAGASSGSLQTGELYCNFRGSSSTVTLETNNSKVYDDKMWHHIAVTKQGTTGRLYLDGEKKDEDTVDGSMNTNLESVTSWIGGYDNHGSTSGTSINAYVTGYINDFKIYKGVAKYTEDYFLPASKNPTIISDSPSGTVYDSALEKPVSGSTTVKKEGDENIKVAASSDFAFGTGDFTVEGYFYIISSGSNSCAWDFRDGTSSAQFFMKCVNNTAWNLRFGAGSAAGTSVCSFSAYKRAWNHIAVSRAGTSLKVFVNGVLTNSVSNSDDATVTGPLHISTFTDTPSNSGEYGFTGAVSSFRVVKGTALYTQDFVPSTKPLTNVTNTKLLFCNNDSSATSATVTPATITVTGTQTLPSPFSPFETSIDGVLGKGSDYCIWNELDNYGGTPTRGGLYWVSGGPGNVTGTIGMPLNSGKYYWEYTLAGGSASGVYGIGYGGVRMSGTALADFSGAGIKIYGYSPNGSKYENDSATGYGPTMIVGDTVSVLFDSYTRELVFWINGVSQGLAYTVAVPDLGRIYTPMCHGNNSGAGGANIRATWGQNPFKYKPPEGYKTLNTQNLPNGITTPATSAAACVLWTGNQTLTQINIGFQPDLIWGYYPAGSNSCYWADTVRGRNKFIYSNQDANESTNNNVIDSANFNDTGFRIGTSTELNGNSNTYMGWCFKAGGQKNTFNIDDVGYASAAAAGLDGGNIDPTAASVGTRQGLSIIKYEGNGSSSQTIAHGLGKTPSQVVVKRLTGGSGNTGDWMMSGVGLSGWNYYMVPNKTQAEYNDFSPFGTPTSSLFTVGSSDRVNNNGDDYIAYVWANIPGVQNFGGYKGNGSTNGAFIYTGFRPALLIVKVITSGQSERWYMWDNKRDPYNSVYKYKDWGAAMAQQTGTNPIVDFVSNGFKFRNGSSNYWNGAYNYVYMAWAESPLGNLYGGQANAR